MEEKKYLTKEISNHNTSIYIWIDYDNNEIYISNKDDIEVSTKYIRASFIDAKKLLNGSDHAYKIILI